MREKLLNKGIAGGKIDILPPRSHDSEVSFDAAGRERFRQAHGLQGKFVVVYSGNNSPCHPLDTIMTAAQKLADRPDIAFCFLGGGSEFKRVKVFAQTNGLSNVLCLPYPPTVQLAGSLSAPDLHFVVMGNPFAGIVHPCKIYNIMFVGAPLLYVGPEPSHISMIRNQVGPGMVWVAVGHGEVAGCGHEAHNTCQRNEIPTITERWRTRFRKVFQTRIGAAPGQNHGSGRPCVTQIANYDLTLRNYCVRSF